MKSNEDERPRHVRSLSQDKLRVEHLERELTNQTKEVERVTSIMLEMANDLLKLKNKLGQKHLESR